MMTCSVLSQAMHRGGATAVLEQVSHTCASGLASSILRLVVSATARANHRFMWQCPSPSNLDRCEHAVVVGGCGCTTNDSNMYTADDARACGCTSHAPLEDVAASSTTATSIVVSPAFMMPAAAWMTSGLVEAVSPKM